MAKALKVLRGDLARLTARLHQGNATGGALNTIVDTGELVHLTQADAVVGAIAYILWDAGGAGAAPEGQWRRITDYNPATWTITLERNLTAAVAVGDVYQVFLAPLVLDDWDRCINLAIVESWPEVFDRLQHEAASTGADDYDLSAVTPIVEDVLGVAVIPGGDLAGYPVQVIPAAGWQVHGAPGDSLTVSLRAGPPVGNTLRFLYAARYAELEDPDDESGIDQGYLMAAARAHLYGALADAAGALADRSGFMQLMAHWQKVAEARKAALGAQLRSPSAVRGEVKRGG
jgi:hypothetical protein